MQDFDPRLLRSDLPNYGAEATTFHGLHAEKSKRITTYQGNVRKSSMLARPLYFIFLGDQFYLTGGEYVFLVLRTFLACSLDAEKRNISKIGPSMGKFLEEDVYIAKMLLL